MQCRTPISAANARSKRPVRSQVRPLSTTSCRYLIAFGPMVRGKGEGSFPTTPSDAAAPYFARSMIFAKVLTPFAVVGCWFLVPGSDVSNHQLRTLNQERLLLNIPRRAIRPHRRGTLPAGE